MRIRQHEFNTLGWCVYCGAASWERVTAHLSAQGHAVPAEDRRQCLWRDAAALMPEPKRREIACEDAAAIAGRLAELAEERSAGEVYRHCAAREGRPKNECHQCESTGRCLACARTHEKSLAVCALCWSCTSKPCP